MISITLTQIAQRWSEARPAERANFQSYLIELCHALGVEAPRPAGSGYEFEYPVTVVSRDGSESVNFIDFYIDFYKEGHFVLEAKDQAEGQSSDLLLRKAFGQAQTYAKSVPGSPPPYLLVLDVGKTLLVWDRWSGMCIGVETGSQLKHTRLSSTDFRISFHERSPMRLARTSCLALVLALLAACEGENLFPGATSANQPSAAGSWSGTAAGTTFSLTLSAGTGGALSGSGTMSDANRATSVTITGTHTHPDISLRVTPQGFAALTFEGRFTSGSVIEGRLNGSGFSNDALMLRRQ